MRYFLVVLGIWLLPIQAFAFNDAVVVHCSVTPQPKHCLTSFLDYEIYGRDYLQFLEDIEKDPIGHWANDLPAVDPNDHR
jgi:hypothetical protein